MSKESEKADRTAADCPRYDQRFVRLKCEYVTMSRIGWTDGEREFPGLKHLFPMHEGATMTLTYEPNAKLRCEGTSAQETKDNL